MHKKIKKLTEMHQIKHLIKQKKKSVTFINKQLNTQKTTNNNTLGSNG